MIHAGQIAVSSCLRPRRAWYMKKPHPLHFPLLACTFALTGTAHAQPIPASSAPPAASSSISQVETLKPQLFQNPILPGDYTVVVNAGDFADGSVIATAPQNARTS